MIPRSRPNACAALLAQPYVRTGTLQPRGSLGSRSSRGDSSHADAYGREGRVFRAAFECHLAVVRAILGELSPGRCDGAPRGLEASSRSRDCATTCGTFALGLGTTPEDAQRPSWARALGFGAPAAVASSSLASHKTHETGSIWLQRSASDLCCSRAPQIR